MNIFTQLKCALCPRWSCHARYKIGNRTYYSHLGFVSTKCPKKQGKLSFYSDTEQVNVRQMEEKLRKVQNNNMDNNNEKNEE